MPRTVPMLAVVATMPWRDSSCIVNCFLCVDLFLIFESALCEFHEFYNIVAINSFFVKSTRVNFCRLRSRTQLGTEDNKGSLKYVEFKLSAGYTC